VLTKNIKIRLWLVANILVSNVHFSIKQFPKTTVLKSHIVLQKDPTIPNITEYTRY